MAVKLICVIVVEASSLFTEATRHNKERVVSSGLVLRWHAAWQERCQALERLRMCISRKRISFRLFKQWYWESFDDDVQVGSGGSLAC